jgi:hypothetical protein
MFSEPGTYRRGPEKGEIPLFTRGSIGLHSWRDAIGLYPKEQGPPYQVLAGFTFYFTSRGRGPSDMDIDDILRPVEMRLKLPGNEQPYFANMSEWYIYKILSPGSYLYRPRFLTLTGEEGHDVCFSILDKFPFDPGFPYWQYGRIIETDKPTSSKQRQSLYRVGLNVPVSEVVLPSWATDIPSEEELFEMMKSGLWKGIYEIEIDLQAFDVHPVSYQYNHCTTLVWLGLSKFDTGTLSTVLYNYVGDKTKSWPDTLWEGAALKMLSGAAAGNEYTIAANFSTDNNPPPGLPANEHLLKIDITGSTPLADGAQKGDQYEVKLPFIKHYEQMFFEKIEFMPGSYDAHTLKYSFEVD